MMFVCVVGLGRRGMERRKGRRRSVSGLGFGGLLFERKQLFLAW